MTPNRLRWALRLPILLPFLLLAIGTAAGEESDRFRLVAAGSAGSLAERIEAAASDGYRVMATAQGAAIDGKNRIVVLLEQRPETGPVDYRVLESSGDLDQGTSGRSLNDWAGDGFRLTPETLLAKRTEDWWLPDSNYENQLVLILEHRPVATRYHYTRIGISTVQQFETDLAAGLADGYGVVGMWNAGRSVSVVLERVVGAAGHPLVKGDDTPIDDDTYRLLIGANRLGMKQQIKSAARDRYRLLDVLDQSINAPPMVLLKRLPPAADPLEIKLMYDSDRKIDNDKLQKKLNKQGYQGFRISARSMTRQVVGLERPRENAKRVNYRALSLSRSDDFSQTLESALAAGFDFRALLVSADEIVAVVSQVTDDPVSEPGR